jgi:hypothetical protein
MKQYAKQFQPLNHAPIWIDGEKTRWIKISCNYPFNDPDLADPDQEFGLILKIFEDLTFCFKI